MWAEARALHFGDGENKASLDLIESALFCVVLDDTLKGDEEPSVVAASLFHGTGTTRWVDKSFSVVCFPNGKLGLHVEHSWADAPVISHVFEWCLQVNEPKGCYDKDGHCKMYDRAKQKGKKRG